MKTLHKTPEGYRRLKHGEIIMATDWYNSKNNTSPRPHDGNKKNKDISNLTGFLLYSANTGSKYKRDWACAYYRKK